MNKNSLNNLKKAKRFDKYPEFINKDGRPSKVITVLTDYIEKKYGKRPPKGEVLLLMEYIETLSISKLQEFVKDESIPAIIIAYAEVLLNGDNKSLNKVHVAEMINDRLHGRPKQESEVKILNEKINMSLNFDNELKEEEQKKEKTESTIPEKTN